MSRARSAKQEKNTHAKVFWNPSAFDKSIALENTDRDGDATTTLAH